MTDTYHYSWEMPSLSFSIDTSTSQRAHLQPHPLTFDLRSTCSHHQLLSNGFSPWVVIYMLHTVEQQRTTYIEAYNHALAMRRKEVRSCLALVLLCGLARSLDGLHFWSPVQQTQHCRCLCIPDDLFHTLHKLRIRMNDNNYHVIQHWFLPSMTLCVPWMLTSSIIWQFS